jgi:hypothetical protein
VRHEFGHILQCKKGMSPSGPWQMEPHADFMAGWALAPLVMPKHDANLEIAIGIIFRMGDTIYGIPSGNGSSRRRDAGNLDIGEAFEKAKVMSGFMN